MPVIKNKSYREKLVKIILNVFFEDILFDLIVDNDILSSNLQKKLNLNFKFKTKVNSIKREADRICGEVCLLDDCDHNQVVNFTVNYTSPIL